MLMDLTGQRFGKLVVLCFDHVEKKQRYWKCQCDCGNTTVVPTASLNRGNTTSCGCGKVQQIKDLTGLRFGRLVVLGMCNHIIGEDVRWNCRCDCGKELSVSGHSLKRGITRSCGCYQKERAAELCKTRERRVTVSKKKNHRLYDVWRGMVNRCCSPSHKSYHTYGGAGITVCDEWKDFSAFREWAYATGYDENAPKFQCTLDRIDVTKGYSPDNCRWVDMKVQNRNTRRNVVVEYQGKSYVAKDLAIQYGVDPHTFITRLNLGLSVGDALSLPKGSVLKKGWYSPVICVETGVYFSSVKDAAAFVSKNTSGICVALREPHRTCGGYHWRYAKKEP